MIGDCITPTHYHKDKDGYSRIKYDKRKRGLHQVMWLLCYGEIPEGMCVCHSCNNKSCCNPLHLYLATPKENSTHASRDGLYRTGKDHPKWWGNDELVATVRLDYENGMTQQAIADRLGVAQSTVSMVLAGKRKGDTR